MRYVTIRPRAGTQGELLDSPMLEARTVHEAEPVDTGILDHEGRAIFRVMSPVGFVALKERK